MSRTKVLPILLLVGVLSLLIPLGVAMGQGDHGTVRIMDTGDGLSNAANIMFDDAPSLAPNQAYEGWFVNVGPDGPVSPPVSAGILVPDANGNINQGFVQSGANAGENLLGAFNTFIISVEPIPDPDAGPSADKPYAHTIPAGALAHIRHVVYSWMGNPVYTSGFYAGQDLPKGIVVGLREQTNTALTHANLSVGSGTIGGIKTHACRVINILEGTGGDNFDGSCGNPGDGFGALNYAVDMKHAGFAAGAAPDDNVVVRHGKEAVDSANQSTAWAVDARDQALLALGSTDTAAARLFISNAQESLRKALMGFDADGDGVVERITGEGGAWQAYGASQDMGTFTLTATAVVDEEDPPIKLPAAGDSNVPTLALAALMLGALLLVGGGVIFRVSRRRA
jgi:LPXTG-motif cell wall-anchored protein